MPSIAEIKDMLSSRPVGGGRGFVNPPMAKREPLKMPEGMDDQPPSKQIEEAKRQRDMERAYNESTVKKAKGGACYAKGGKIDGCAQRGKTRGRVV